MLTSKKPIITMKEVCNAFMENDKKGLELLYQLTNDDLCNILIGWLNMEELDNVYTNEFTMYNEIVSYLWDKYDIGGNKSEE